MHNRILSRLLRSPSLSHSLRNYASFGSVCVVNGIPSNGARSLLATGRQRSYGCSQILVQHTLFKYRGVCSSADGFYDVPYEDFKKMSQDHKYTIIDVREPKERMDPGIISDTHSIPLGQIVEAFDMEDEQFEKKYKFKKPSPDDDKVILHCLGGIRSRRAMNSLHQLGYTKVRHYLGGVEDWLERGEKLTTDSAAKK